MCWINQVFERLLWLSPSDNLGLRFLMPRVTATARLRLPVHLDPTYAGSRSWTAVE